MNDTLSFSFSTTNKPDEKLAPVIIAAIISGGATLGSAIISRIGK
jgi:hypothetical protein